MTCTYCQFSNTEEDHRCRRCGRRLAGTAVAAPAHLAKEHAQLAVRVLGANALAVARAPVTETRSAPGIMAARAIDTAATLDELPQAAKTRREQPSLFGGEQQPKIIPFENFNRAAASASVAELLAVPGPKLAPPLTVKAPPVKAARRKEHAVPDAQSTLDFLPPQKHAPRTLKTSAEAVIFCDASVASPVHRATAAALDLSMVVLAFGAILITFETLARPESFDRYSLIGIAVLFLLTALFYGLLFAISGAVTPGMRWTKLRLINFDGFPPDGRSRALRFVVSWISLASAGLGIVWALLDEENLTWHDHVSKTFPTAEELESVVVRHRVGR